MDPSPVVIEGKLLKRGEYISTWRTRWFVLRADGTFRGFKQQPANDLEPPINLFEVSPPPPSLSLWPYSLSLSLSLRLSGIEMKIPSYSLSIPL